MAAIRTSNLALSFVLELGMLAAIAYWGFSTGSNVWTSIVLGVLAVAAVIVFWGLFMSPQARMPVRDPWHTTIALVLFGLATLILYTSGYHVLAIVFGGLVVLNQVLKHLFVEASGSDLPLS